MTGSRAAIALAVAVFTTLLAFAAAPQARPPTTPGDRFDLTVRADFFAGFRSDAARLARGMSSVRTRSPRSAMTSTGSL
jgi:hypothetical protein